MNRRTVKRLSDAFGVGQVARPTSFSIAWARGARPAGNVRLRSAKVPTDRTIHIESPAALHRAAMIRSFRTRVDQALGVIVPLCAVAVTVSVVYRTFVAVPASAELGTAKYSEVWREAVAAARPIIGSQRAPMSVLVFSDFECPGCADFHATIKALLKEYPNVLQLLYVPFPLTYHKHALPAARIAECIGDRDLLARWIDLVYEKRDSIGVKSWGAFAGEAGIQDTTYVRACVDDPFWDARINGGRKLGERININATPTVIINGWRYSGVPTFQELKRVAEELEGGRNPWK